MCEYWSGVWLPKLVSLSFTCTCNYTQVHFDVYTYK